MEQQKKKRKKLIIVGLGVVALFSYLFVFKFTQNKNINPQPINTPLPTPIATSIKNDLSLINAFPPEGTIEIGETQNAISLKFSKPVNENTIILSISPDLKLNKKQSLNEPNIILITPNIPWLTGETYTITIHDALSKDTLSRLNQRYNFTYTIVEPEFPIYPQGPI